MTRAGIPDVFYAFYLPNRGGRSGWFELKRIGAWPKRARTAINVPHLTREQVIFAEELSEVDCRVYTLLQVDRTYLLLEKILTRAVFERRATREMLLSNARVVGQNEFPTRAIVRAVFDG